jgi:DNA-binding transcriptional LysR family regulator
VTTRDDRMFNELDRQLEDVREQASALAGRSTLILAVTAVAATVLSSRIQRESADYSLALWPLGVALIASIVSMAPNLKLGPLNAELARLALSTTPAAQAVSQLYYVKLATLEANKTRLAVATWAFYVTLVAAVVAIVMALIVAGGQVSKP